MHALINERARVRTVSKSTPAYHASSPARRAIAKPHPTHPHTPPNAARNCGAPVACPRAPHCYYRPLLHRLFPCDARPSTARRPSPGPHTRPCRSTTTSGTGRVAPTRCDASRSDGHTTPRTAHSPRPAHSNGGRAEWAPGLTGLGRGRRAMPASTSTTERHDQPARLHPCAGPGRPPATIARPAATRQRSPRPSRPGVQRGGFLAVATIRARGDLHKISAGERLETVTVHLCILRNAACHHCAGASQ